MALGIDLSGKVALVAGASRGIGADTARAFARAGAAVVIGARDGAALANVAGDIVDSGGQALPVTLDVGDAHSMQEFVAAALDRFGRLDIAFNNATAGPPPARLADIDAESFDLGIRTNIRGTFLGLKYQVPAMTQGGAIVNMASVAALRPTARLGAYVTGKSGIIALSRVAALDYADRGIRVNVVAPGPILTHHLARAGERALAHAARAVPLGRVGSTEDVSDAVLWLSSPAAGFVTGAVLPVDGGQSAGLMLERAYEEGKPMD